MDFKKIIKEPEYNFLRDNKHLGDNIILLVLGGSHAYGTNNKNSDVDIRGCALEKATDLIGFTKFNQVVETRTDTTIYSFNKLISLLINSNPNTIEILGCKPEHYLYVSKEGQELLDNKSLFLSQRCISSFGGYAYQQLNRLNSALAEGELKQAKEEEHILNSIKSAMLTFNTRYSQLESGSMNLNIQNSKKEELEKEIYIDIDLNNYPLRDFLAMFSEMENILKSYGKLNHRNKKRDNQSLDKHAMHLIRLYLMAIDLLEKEEIVTYREHDLKLLRDIREGKFRLEDGTYHNDFFTMVETYKKEMDYAIRHTNLPKKPNMKEVEEFTMAINKKIIDKARQ